MSCPNKTLSRPAASSRSFEIISHLWLAYEALAFVSGCRASHVTTSRQTLSTLKCFCCVVRRRIVMLVQNSYLAKWCYALNWECIYVICIHRCHLLLATFHVKSYIGINRRQREDSPWATLLPHRWVQVITRMVLIMWTYVKCIKMYKSQKRYNMHWEICTLHL